MVSLIILVTCIVMAISGYAPPQGAHGSYGAAPVYPEIYADPFYYEDDYHHNHEHKHQYKKKKNYEKLKDITGITAYLKADIVYYHDKGNYYALISCQPNPTYPPTKYTWIMVNSNENAHISLLNTIPGYIPIAGGTNNTYTAQYDKDGKWMGQDFLEYKMRTFRRVGCLMGQMDNESYQK